MLSTLCTSNGGWNVCRGLAIIDCYCGFGRTSGIRSTSLRSPRSRSLLHNRVRRRGIRERTLSDVFPRVTVGRAAAVAARLSCMFSGRSSERVGPSCRLLSSVSSCCTRGRPLPSSGSRIHAEEVSRAFRRPEIIVWHCTTIVGSSCRRSRKVTCTKYGSWRLSFVAFREAFRGIIYISVNPYTLCLSSTTRARRVECRREPIIRVTLL